MESILLNSLNNIKEYNPLICHWDKSDWVFYFIIIPAILVFIFLLPSEIRHHFILNFQNPTIFSIFANHYTHSTTSHLGNNLGVYLLVMFAIFNIVIDKPLFYQVSAVLFTVLPIVLSMLMLWFLPNLPPAQGFSAIGSGFIGYLIYAVYSFLKNNFKFIKQSLFSLILMLNFLTLVIIKNFDTKIVALIALITGIYLVINYKDILALAKEGQVYYNKIPKGVHLEIIYKSSIFASCFIFTIALPFIIPATIVSNGIITNTIGHYIGWIFGFFVPIILGALSFKDSNSH